ncbi:MAG: RICIN domain-containing protein, partial [Granulosicoccaceae bacterium]
ALTRKVSGPEEFDAKVKSAASGLCLDLNAYSIDNDYPLQQWDCADTENQRVWFDTIADESSYRLRLQHSGKCLEPAYHEAGAEVRQWVCHRGDYERPDVSVRAQHWQVNALGGGHYSLISVDSNLALTTHGSDRGSKLTLEPWTNDSSQRFKFESRHNHPSNPADMGTWGPLIAWPHVPVHAAVTPDNTIVTWASNELDDYPQATGSKFSWSSVYDPASNSFLETNNPAHDMFCAGTSLLEDGSLLASGGNPRAAETSHFDPQSNRWTLAPYMRQQRWYGTNVVTGSGDVFSTFAKGAQEVPELFSVGANAWHDVPGADMSLLRDDQDLANTIRGNSSAEMQWYSFMHTAPDGRVFQSGPTDTMHWFNTEGPGDTESAGSRGGEEARNRQFGSAVMYDVGKLLISGGSDPMVSGELSPDGRRSDMGATDTAMTIDISGATPLIETVEPMNSRRANHNAVVLPTGEVYVVGGTEWGLLFDDRYSAWWPEIWNPESRKWRTVAALSTPRTYHSWALLLRDGRVLSGGGGLCGDCSANHPDAQIYTPPYLYDSDGHLALRPEIISGSTETTVGGYLNFQTDGPVAKFNMVRLSSVTHSINTDQRFISLETESLGDQLYIAQLSSNVNVMIPGMYWVFAVNDLGVPSEGHLLQVKSTAKLELLTGFNALDDIQATIGSPIDIQLPTTGLDQNQLTFSAIGLPDGLQLDASTGRLHGTLTKESEGSMLISVADGAVQTTVRLHYRVGEVKSNISTGAFGS